MKRLIIVGIGLLALATTLASCKKGEFDAREAATALADEFSDMLEFENGSVEDGAPPESDADGPELDSFTAPLLAGAEETLPDGTVIGYDYEQWFPVLFRSKDSLANLEHVKGAIVFVQQANKDDVAERYLKVEPYELREPIGDEQVFTFRAVVHRLAALRQGLSSALRGHMGLRDVPDGMAAADGNAYHIYIALFSRLPDGTEKVGNYLIWNLSTYPGEAGDTAVDMCTAKSLFASNVLQDTNVEDYRGVCDESVTEAFSERPSESSPCGVWNRFAAGYNTIVDAVITLANDPDYQERAMVLYPAGTRFFLHGRITSPPLTVQQECVLELASCEADEARCDTDADCSTPDHECCDNLCRDTSISDNFCGGCDIQCGGSDECLAGLCGQQQDCVVDADCPVRDQICCLEVCYDSQTDPQHCGDCTTTCDAGLTCITGQCCPAGGCGGEILIAEWRFEPGAMGMPSLEATTVAAHVIADDFTSVPAPPTRMTTPGPEYWAGINGWDSPATLLMCILSTEPGWFMNLTRIEFDQAMVGIAAGSPTTWELEFMGGPGPIGSGPISTEAPEFLHVVVDVPPDIHDRQFTELIWRALNGQVAGHTWGLDNIQVYGHVVDN